MTNLTDAHQTKSAANPDFIELYKIVRAGQQSWADQHLQYLFQFLVAIGSFTTITFGGFLIFRDNKALATLALLVPLAGLAFNIVLSFFAFKVCDRAYRRFLEEVSICSKLEAELGFWNERPPGSKLFRNDKYFLPDRWLKASEKELTVAEFVDRGLCEGVNLYSRIVFVLIFLANAAFFLWSITNAISNCVIFVCRS